MARVYPRQRLFGVLDKARSKHSVVWVQGPPGAGKTTLIASYLKARKLSTLWYQIDAGDSDIASFFYYIGLAAKQATPRQRKALPLLTPEYRAGLPTFTRNYFRELFSRLKRPSVLVLDNYQDVSAQSAIQEVLPHGLSEIPSEINVIVISRNEPPAAVARLRTSGNITVLGWEELQLTEKESLGIAELRPDKKRLSRTAIQAVHEQTRGWIAGLVLMLEQTHTVFDTPRAAGVDNPTVLFDYFANEIFRHTDPTIQEFLVKTAFLPKISVSVAQQLTGAVNAERILNDLARRNYFTVRHTGTEGSYAYHPLFEAFLGNQAMNTYTPKQIKELKQRSAQLLAESGDIETAVSLLLQVEDWPSATRLILDQASALVKQGRNQTLVTWLHNLPAPVREENPWALYWLGVCRLPFDPAEARGFFERAFALFEDQIDSAPLYLAWSGIIDSFLIEWNDFTPMDRWLDVFHSLQSHRQPPSPEIEAASVLSYVGGLFYRRPDDPDLPDYAQQAEAVFLRESDVNRRFSQGAPLIYYYLWTREVAKADYLLQTFSPQSTAIQMNPPARIMWCAMKSFHAYVTSSPDDCLHFANDGLALAETSGVHVFDPLVLRYCVLGYLHVGDVAAARATVRRMAPLVTGRALLYDGFYNYLASMVSQHEGELARAVEEGRRAVHLSKASGVLFGEAACLLTLASARARNGDTDGALTDIGEARAISLRMNSKLITYLCAFTEASVRLLRGEHAQTLDVLHDALTLAKEAGIVGPAPWCLRQEAATLYSMALEAGFHQDYVRTAIAKTRLPPPPDLLPDHWPWPIRIFTLGRFSLLRDDKPVQFHVKAQKKPLELLKALIAYGGREVREERLAETLWPDTEADAAAQVLATTLHRLRKLLGDEVIQRQEGRLTLDARYCWVDVWALERLLARVEAVCREGRLEEIPPLTERLLAHYRGGFLQGGDDAPWVLSVRERIRTKYLRLLETAGTCLRQANQHERALTCYRRALEVDSLAEALYQGLMRCYLDLNRPAQALTTYRRCCEMLRRDLHVAPSADTERLAREIQEL